MKFSAMSFQLAAISYSSRRSSRHSSRRKPARRSGRSPSSSSSGGASVVEADEDQESPLLAAHRVEAVVGLVERLGAAHVEDRRADPRGTSESAREERRPEALPVQVVGPRVVRALEEALGVARARRRTAARRDAGTRCDARAARPSRLRQTITERPATSTTRKSPGAATSSATHTGIHERANTCSRSSSK